MEFNFLEYFYTYTFDDKVIIKSSIKSYSVREIKDIIAQQVWYLKSYSAGNVLINTQDNFSFIVLFLSCIFAQKNIVICNNNNKNDIQNFDDIVCISEIVKDFNCKNFQFPKIDPNTIGLTINTSGTTFEPKIIKKNIQCVIKESIDTIDILGIKDQKLEFITSTPINHLYAITAYIFTPLNSGNIINTDKIDYLENLTVQNSVLVTSPSFLSYIQKHNLCPENSPKIILSAGSELKQSTHQYFEKYSKVINLYGCTETGFIAYKTRSNEEAFQLFKGIRLLTNNNEVRVLSNYSLQEEIFLDDEIEIITNDSIAVIGRSDRLYKIQEKRVSAVQLEIEIKKNELINNCCIVKLDDKIGAIAELTFKGVQFLLQYGIVELVGNLKTNLLKKFSIVPQKWKFTDEIPVNDLGKFDFNKINEIFNLNLSIPYVINKTINSQCAEFELFFYKNCNFFKGHFDKFPIVAGVVQLFFAVYYTKIAYDIDCHIGQIKRIKFSNIIHSDSVVKLKLTKKDNSVIFEYYDENNLYSSGCMPLENVFKKVNN